MRYREFQENHATNSHLGLGQERPQDQRVMERPRPKRKEKKLKDNTAFGMGNQAAGGNWANTGAKFHKM
jgi:hypothetical protein